MKTTIGGRLSLIMQHKKMNQKEFSAFINCPASSISEFVNNKRGASLQTLVAILDACPEINEHWLLKGDGKMIFSMQEQKILEVFNSLNETQKNDIFSIAEEKKFLNEVKNNLSLLLANQPLLNKSA